MQIINQIKSEIHKLSNFDLLRNQLLVSLYLLLFSMAFFILFLVEWNWLIICLELCIVLMIWFTSLILSYLMKEVRPDVKP